MDFEHYWETFKFALSLFIAGFVVLAVIVAIGSGL